jgi:hypothetical protein
MWPRRSPGNGGKPPSHSLSGSRAGRLRAAGRAEAKGRAADEAAARRKLRACPLADAKAAGFVKRPSVSRRPSGTWETIRRDTGPSGSGPARRKAGLRSTRRHRRGRSFGSGFAGQDRASARELRNRRTQDLGPWTPGGTEASAEDQAIFGTAASAKEPGWREAGRKFQIRQPANRQGFGPVGEPAGKPRSGFGRHGTPEEAAPRTPGSRRRPLETAQRGTPRLPG